MPSQRTYPRASAADPVTRFDLVSILDSHGLRLPPEPVGGDEARELHRLYLYWIHQQGIRPGRAYVIPLRVLFGLLADEHGGARNEAGLHAWQVLVDGINDEAGAASILRRRYAGRSAA